MVAGFYNINQTGFIIIIGHIMASGENGAGELHCDLIGVIPLAIVNIRTRLVGGSDTYNLEVNVFKIELILDCIF